MALLVVIMVLLSLTSSEDFLLSIAEILFFKRVYYLVFSLMFTLIFDEADEMFKSIVLFSSVLFLSSIVDNFVWLVSLAGDIFVEEEVSSDLLSFLFCLIISCCGSFVVWDWLLTFYFNEEKGFDSSSISVMTFVSWRVLFFSLILEIIWAKSYIFGRGSLLPLTIVILIDNLLSSEEGLNELFDLLA